MKKIWDDSSLERLLKSLHGASFENRNTVEQATLCGCFNCGYQFSPSILQEWDFWQDREGDTAVCPNCGIDCVLDNVACRDIPLDEDLLALMGCVYHSQTLEDDVLDELIAKFSCYVKPNESASRLSKRPYEEPFRYIDVPASEYEGLYDPFLWQDAGRLQLTLESLPTKAERQRFVGEVNRAAAILVGFAYPCHSGSRYLDAEARIYSQISARRFIREYLRPWKKEYFEAHREEIEQAKREREERLRRRREECERKHADELKNADGLPHLFIDEEQGITAIAYKASEKTYGRQGKRIFNDDALFDGVCMTLELPEQSDDVTHTKDENE